MWLTIEDFLKSDKLLSIMKLGALHLAFVLVVIVNAPLPVYAQPESTGLESLSDSERDLLRYGRIVTRRQAQIIGRGYLYGGTSYQRIKAPPDAVWRAIIDIPRYPHLLPEVTEASLVQRSSSKRLVFLRHGRGIISAQYHLMMNYNVESRALHFHVDQTRSRSVRRGQGYLTVHPYGEEQSVVTFKVLADIGGGMISGILRPQIQDGILRVPQTMKRYIEGNGRTRYIGQELIAVSN